MSRNKEHRPNGAAAEFYIMIISYLYVLNMFHIFSFVCILKIMNLLSKTYDLQGSGSMKEEMNSGKGGNIL